MASWAENLAHVSELLDHYPNLFIDFAGPGRLSSAGSLGLLATLF